MDTTELLEVLLCPECDSELSAPNPCGAPHLWLADNPLAHRLLRPLVEQVLQSLSTDKVCVTCKAEGKGEVQIARGDCPHVLIREGQVTMTRRMWLSITNELVEMRKRAV